MNYAIIEDGKVKNIIVADEDFANSIGAVLCEEFTVIGDLYSDGVFSKEIIAVKPIDSVTDLQARLALEQIGKLETVEIMAKANPLFSIWFDRALNWKRDNEYVISASTALGMSEAELDSLFLLASTL